MGGQIVNEYHSRLHDKLFNEGNPQYKSQDAKLKDIRSDCKEFVRAFESSFQALNERIDGIVVPPDNSESIAALHSEVSILKSAFTSLLSHNDEMKNQIDELKKEMKTFTTKTETMENVNSFRQMLKENVVETQKLKNAFDSVKQGFAVAKPAITVGQPKIPEPVKDDLNGWVTMSELIEHLKGMRAQGKANINPSFLVLGKINKLFVRLHIVKKIGNGTSLQVSGTNLGKMEGYVRDIATSNGHSIRYNIEKCTSLLERCSTPESLLKIMDALDDKFCHYQMYEDIE